MEYKNLIEDLQILNETAKGSKQITKWELAIEELNNIPAEKRTKEQTAKIFRLQDKIDMLKRKEDAKAIVKHGDISKEENFNHNLEVEKMTNENRKQLYKQGRAISNNLTLEDKEALKTIRKMSPDSESKNVNAKRYIERTTGEQPEDFNKETLEKAKYNKRRIKELQKALIKPRNIGGK